MRSTRGVGLTNRKEGEREDLVVLALVFVSARRSRYRPAPEISIRCYTGVDRARAGRIRSGSGVWKREKDDTCLWEKVHSLRRDHFRK